mmetsp:Transcript_24419/g.52652  ORF Transcript_24419/g.52652 Transcript_24419/m.52652 type:complete len:639 (-) Transcript_24419:1115-3031(-)
MAVRNRGAIDGGSGQEPTPRHGRDNVNDYFSDGTSKKAEGNRLFAIRKYKAAITFYEESIWLLDNSNNPERKMELSKVYANMAECHLRLDEYSNANKAATRALSCNEHNTKALFRRARARMEMSDFRGATKDGMASGSREGEKLAVKAQSKIKLYGQIIDSYRLRMEDAYTQTGDVDIGSLYSGDVLVPVKHFRGYLKLGISRNAFPGQFSSADFDSIVKFAKEDEWHNIRYSVELSDIKQHYAKLGSTMEFVKLRQLATKLMGPVLVYMWDDAIEIRDYMSDSDESFGSHDDIGDSFDSHDDSDDELQWMYEPPFSPYQPLIDCNDPAFGQQCGEFMIRFNSDYPIHYLRLNIDLAFCDGMYHGLHYSDFFSILLQGKFGHCSNGLQSDKFSSMLQKVTHNHRKLLEEQIPTRIKEAGPVTGPDDWHFDHYGTLCSLTLVAFNLLTEDERDRADIQKRLAHVLLSGEEDTLTGHCTIFHSSFQDGFADDLPRWEWDGPKEYDSIPCSWNEGDGTVLLQKAWEVWQSIVTARKVLDCVKNKPSNTPCSVTDDINNLIQLPCFSKFAVVSLARPAVYEAAPWDANCDVIRMYYTAVELAARAYMAVGQVERASELVREANDRLGWCYRKYNCFVELIKY